MHHSTRGVPLGISHAPEIDTHAESPSLAHVRVYKIQNGRWLQRDPLGFV